MSERTDHIDGILAQWARQRPDLDTAALGLFGRIFRICQLADLELGEGLRAHDLPTGWFDLLAALRRAGSPYELNPTRLMAATMVSSGGITKRLDHLVEAGLVERKPDPADRRGVLVRLTRRGRAAIDRAIEVHIANEEHLLGSLSRAERKNLDELLAKLLVDLESRRSSFVGENQMT